MITIWFCLLSFCFLILSFLVLSVRNSRDICRWVLFWAHGNRLRNFINRFSQIQQRSRLRLTLSSYKNKYSALSLHSKVVSANSFSSKYYCDAYWKNFLNAGFSHKNVSFCYLYNSWHLTAGYLKIAFCF